jgi:hypothetical protein
MNKKFLLAGLVAVTGYLALTAFFDGKTLAQQKAEIAQLVTSKLEGIRADKVKECDDRVSMEAKARFEKAMAEKPAEKPTVAGSKKPVKKGGAKGPKVDPLPQAPPPADPSQAKKDKTSGNAPVNTDAKKSKTSGEAPAPNTNLKKSKTAGNAPAGGGN